MNESFRVYNDSAIWNSLLEFPVTLAWTETHNFTCILKVTNCKIDVTLSIVNVTRPYVIDDFMKIKLVTE